MDGNNDYASKDGWRHNTTYWNENGITHHESYDYDSQGNIRDLHYGQQDNRGSELAYNYHTDRWQDRSR